MQETNDATEQGTSQIKSEVNNELTPEQQYERLRSEIAAAKAEAVVSAKKERYDRSTVAAFSLLFILPAVIIVLSMIFLLPVIGRTLQQEPSGATTLRSNSGDINMK